MDPKYIFPSRSLHLAPDEYIQISSQYLHLDVSWASQTQYVKWNSWFLFHQTWSSPGLPYFPKWDLREVWEKTLNHMFYLEWACPMWIFVCLIFSSPIEFALYQGNKVVLVWCCSVYRASIHLSAHVILIANQILQFPCLKPSGGISLQLESNPDSLPWAHKTCMISRSWGKGID